MDKTNLRLLLQINHPEDLRKLSVEELPEVCRELREDIIQEASVSPGHFASSLGAIKITAALHYVFDTPSDELVWGVGHQAYGHKILTGRRELSPTNRKLYGLRPLPMPSESQHDTFTCGHASNSTSAALGMAVAVKKSGENGKKIVATIGDGAMSGGLAFEGLNNVSSTLNDPLIVLDDNGMSIDYAVGDMEKHLLTLDMNAIYSKLKFKASRRLHQRGYPGENRKKGILWFNNAIEPAISRQQNIFEGMNIRYLESLDGHDVTKIMRILRQLKDTKDPKPLHLHTTKDKGYKLAKQSQAEWYAPGRFNAEAGEYIVKDCSEEPLRHRDVFGDTLVKLVLQNSKIVGVVPAMPTGCSMNKLMKVMPDRAFGVGIIEGHVVTPSGGMVKEGLQPFYNIYSSFAQHAYDNIIHDSTILNPPVVLCLDCVGLVGEDGFTHRGVFGLAALRPTPNLTIVVPVGEEELKRLMYTAQLPDKGMSVICYPCGRGANRDWKCPLGGIKVGMGHKLKDGDQVTILAAGPIGNGAQKAIEAPPRQDKVAHYDIWFIKPLDRDLSDEIGKKFRKVITIGDGVRSGGSGSAVLEWFNDHGYAPGVQRMGLPDGSVAHGSVDELRKIVGPNVPHIKQNIEEVLASDQI